MSVVALENALLARLRERLVTDLALVKVVYSHREYAELPEQSMVTPSLALIYTGYTVGDKVHPAGGIQDVGFGWLVVVNVRNALNTGTASAVLDAASPIFDAVLAALLGWRPLPKFRPIQLEPAPGAALSDAGFGYYPVAFSTLATYRGT